MADGVQLPTGRTLFTNLSGVPLVGGKVYYYIPTTLTAKDTYQDEGLTTLNTNPVVLDASGTAVMWGSGLYRQIVKDSLGNTISDGVVGLVVTSSSDATAPVIVNAASTTDLGAAASSNVQLHSTGTGNSLLQINSFGSTGTAGETVYIQLTTGYVQLNPSAALVIPNGGNILVMSPGDTLTAVYDGSGNWHCKDYTQLNGVQYIFDRPANSPSFPYTYSFGDPTLSATVYPHFAVFGYYSALHFGGQSCILAQGNGAGGSNIWAWGDDGTYAAPTGWGATPTTQFQLLIWGLDDTNQRVADPATASGSSAFQGRQAEAHFNMYGSQTQTSRPGAIELLTGRDTWQVPTATFWLDQNGGVVLQGQAIKSAVTHSVLTYPWTLSANPYSPIPNLNWIDYDTDANLTLIASDDADSHLESIYRWDKIATGAGATGQSGYRWTYLFSGDTLRLQSIAAPGGGGVSNSVIEVTPTNVSFPGGINLSGTVLTHYDEGTWTPSIDFASVGNLTVAYSAQIGKYTRVGRLVTLSFELGFTPTYTTSTGAIRIKGMTYDAGTFNLDIGRLINATNNLTFTGSSLYLFYSATGVINILNSGSAINSAALTVSAFPTATAQTLYGTFTYEV